MLMAVDFLCSASQTFYDCVVNSCPGVDIPQSVVDSINQKLHNLGIDCGQYYKCTHARAQIHSHTHARARAGTLTLTNIHRHTQTHAGTLTRI